MTATFICRKADAHWADCTDQLSEEAAAKSGKRHWGRWVLSTDDPRSLDCLWVMPSVDGYPQRTIAPYEITLSRIGQGGTSDGGTYTWQEHLSEKNWIGQKGLNDFIRAVTELSQTHPEWLHQNRQMVKSSSEIHSVVEDKIYTTKKGPENTKTKRPILQRLFKHIRFTPEGCWEWKDPHNASRCLFWNGTRRVRIRPWVYNYFEHQTLQANFGLVAACGNIHCVAPSHLKAVSGFPFGEDGYHARAAQQRAKTQCPHGHPYDSENTYWYRNAHGNQARNCRACMHQRGLSKRKITAGLTPSRLRVG